MTTDVKLLTLPQLREEIQNAEARAFAAKSDLDFLLNELNSRLSHEAATLFQNAGKQAGDITFITNDGVKLKASVSKTVSWDNDKLQVIASSMDWAAAQRIFDISFKVPEATFKAIPDVELVAKLEAARTVKYGELKIKPL